MSSSLPVRREREDLATQLAQSFPTLAESLTSDDALPYVPAPVAERALPIVGAAVAPAPADELTFALGWLASVTTGDKLRSPEMMQVSARALVQAMMDYPREAALAAIRDWPKTDNGKWWPTENELRAEADERSWRTMKLHRHLRAATLREDAAAPRTNEPSPIVRAYIDEVQATYGEGFVKSWLSPLTCQYQGKSIWTHPTAVERIVDRTSGLMAKHDVAARWDAASSDAFRKNTEHFEPRKGK